MMIYERKFLSYSVRHHSPVMSHLQQERREVILICYAGACRSRGRVLTLAEKAGNAGKAGKPYVFYLLWLEVLEFYFWA